MGLNSMIFNVDPGCRGVMFDRFRGVLDEVYDEGTHLKIPFVQTPIIYDAKTIPKTLRTSTGSKDLQTVNLSLRVLYRWDKFTRAFLKNEQYFQLFLKPGP